MLGVLIGLRYRVPALVLGTCAAIAWGLIDGWLGQQSLGQVVVRVIVLAFILQAGFLGGVAVRARAGR